MPSQVLRPIPLGQVKLLLPPPLELPPEDPPEEDFRQELPDLLYPVLHAHPVLIVLETPQAVQFDVV